jgi:hypothetical protein
MMKQLIFLLLVIPTLALASEPTPVVKQEVFHLITYLKNSGCQFNRNGSWYSPSEAAIISIKNTSTCSRKAWSPQRRILLLVQPVRAA